MCSNQGLQEDSSCSVIEIACDSFVSAQAQELKNENFILEEALLQKLLTIIYLFTRFRKDLFWSTKKKFTQSAPGSSSAIQNILKTRKRLCPLLSALRHNIVYDSTTSPDQRNGSHHRKNQINYSSQWEEKEQHNRQYWGTSERKKKKNSLLIQSYWGRNYCVLPRLHK